MELIGAAIDQSPAFEEPSISVIIPAYNEEAVIGSCLSSLAGQDYPGRVEVIVVDNASTDATAEVARSYGARVIAEPVRGVCRARQSGTAAATGQIVVSSDADTTFAPTWLSQIAATLSARPELVATCGPCRFVDGPWWSAPYTRSLFGLTAWFFRRTGRVLYASATNIAFRRSAWSGYDLRLTQGGDELGLLRSLRRCGPVHFDPQRLTLTSSRRLRRGLLYSIFVTCLYFYFAAYFVNRIAGRPVLGSAPAFRSGATPAAVAATWWEAWSSSRSRCAPRPERRQPGRASWRGASRPCSWWVSPRRWPRSDSRGIGRRGWASAPARRTGCSRR